jgi:hypothetical protein
LDTKWLRPAAVDHTDPDLSRQHIEESTRCIYDRYLIFRKYSESGGCSLSAAIMGGTR